MKRLNNEQSEIDRQPRNNMRKIIMLVFVVAALVCAVVAQTPTQQGVRVAMVDGSSVEIAVAGTSSFRLSFTFLGQLASQIPSKLIDPDLSTATPFTIIQVCKLC